MNHYDQIMKILGGHCFGANRGEAPIHLSEGQLTELEHKLGNALPADYREFIRHYSGYTLDQSVYFPLIGGIYARGGVSLFFGAGANDDLLNQYQNACDSEWPLEDFDGLKLVRPIELLETLPVEDELTWVKWPAELLPIADNGGNDKTCLVITGEKVGSIFYWVNNARLDEPNLYLVTNSFNEFMNILCINRSLTQIK